VWQKQPDRQQTVFAKQREILVRGDEKRDEVDGTQRPLKTVAGEPELWLAIWIQTALH
jgi:hypothetical protein